MTDSLNVSMPPSSTASTPSVNKDGAKVDSVVPVVPVTPPVTPSVTTTTTTTTISPSGSSSPKPTPKKISKQVLFAVIGLVILVLGAIAGFYLLSRSQELRQQAAGGYLDCAGGVKDGDKACSGFRAYVTCHNGAFNAATTCPANQVCDASSATGCKAEAPQSCAGGVPNGGKSCDTLRSYVTCNDGVFSTPTQCDAGVICSNGICGGTSNTGACDTGSGDSVCRGALPGQTRCLVPGTATTGTCQGNAGGACLCKVATTGPTPTPGGGTCKPSQASCDDGANKCCAGFVCQGSNNSRICQPQTANQCGTGNTCGGSNGWLGFQCDSTNQGSSGTECLSNMRVFSDQASAYAYASANGCGQVDEVCSSGSNQNKLCGAFQIISTGCGGTGGPLPSPTPVASPRPTPSPIVVPSPSPTPSASPSPAPSPTPGVTPSPTPSPSMSPSPSPAPICANISISKSNVVVGDNVHFTCGTVPGATAYEFRVKSPDGTITEVLPVSSGSVQSQSFSIAQQGNYKAQCRICVGGSCQEWETL